MEFRQHRRFNLKHLVVGDVHGYHRNLRDFLRSQNVIDKKGHRINSDTIKVYCTGDLIDGQINRQGDILNLQFASEWFDAVCLGNHEMAFIGSKSYNGKHRQDRKFVETLLRLVDDEVFVPALLIPGGTMGDFLATHAGFSEYFGFDNVVDAYEYIQVMWEVAPLLDEEIAVFDWMGPARAFNYGDPTGGIFELDWSEDRNGAFNQISGHTIKTDGPIYKRFDKEGGIHWNIDVGGKHGKGLGAVLVDDVEGKVEPLFWGERHGTYKSTTSYSAEYWNPLTKSWDKNPHDTEQTTLKLVDTKEDRTREFPGWKEVSPGTWSRDKEKPIAGYLPKGSDPKVTVVESTKNGQPMVTIKSDHSDENWTRTKFRTIPMSELDDIDIKIIDDEDVLDAYREEVSRGREAKIANMLH
jgi:hypothetical protein